MVHTRRLCSGTTRGLKRIFLFLIFVISHHHHFLTQAHFSPPIVYLATWHGKEEASSCQWNLIRANTLTLRQIVELKHINPCWHLQILSRIGFLKREKRRCFLSLRCGCASANYYHTFMHFNNKHKIVWRYLFPANLLFHGCLPTKNDFKRRHK